MNISVDYKHAEKIQKETQSFLLMTPAQRHRKIKVGTSVDFYAPARRGTRFMSGEITSTVIARVSAFRLDFLTDVGISDGSSLLMKSGIPTVDWRTPHLMEVFAGLCGFDSIERLWVHWGIVRPLPTGEYTLERMMKFTESKDLVLIGWAGKDLKSLLSV